MRPRPKPQGVGTGRYGQVALTSGATGAPPMPVR
jgi:hypothetical protein